MIASFLPSCLFMYGIPYSLPIEIQKMSAAIILTEGFSIG